MNYITTILPLNVNFRQYRNTKICLYLYYDIIPNLYQRILVDTNKAHAILY